MSTEQTPEEIGYVPAEPQPRLPLLLPDHFRVLRAAERGDVPDLTRTAMKIAIHECRRWGLVHAERCTLTPLGAQALSKSRAR